MVQNREWGVPVMASVPSSLNQCSELLSHLTPYCDDFLLNQSEHCNSSAILLNSLSLIATV